MQVDQGKAIAVLWPLSCSIASPAPLVRIGKECDSAANSACIHRYSMSIYRGYAHKRFVGAAWGFMDADRRTRLIYAIIILGANEVGRQGV